MGIVTGFAFSGGRTTAPLAAGAAGAAGEEEEVAAALGVGEAAALGVPEGVAVLASFGDGAGVAVELASVNAVFDTGDAVGDGVATVVGAGVWPKIVSAWAVRAISNSKRTFFIIGDPRAQFELG